MQQKLSLRLLPSEAADDRSIKKKLAAAISKKTPEISGYHILKKSIDGRGKNVLINLSLLVFINEPFHQRETTRISFKDTTNASKKVIIIGAGPAGLFAALKLLEAGIQPIVLERG